MRLLHERHRGRGRRAASTNAIPREKQVREALDENLCRCGSHNRVVRAVHARANE